jgi:hypothetical protein
VLKSIISFTLEGACELNFGFQDYAGCLFDPGGNLSHQTVNIDRLGSRHCNEEVGVPLGYRSSPNGEAFQANGIDDSSGRVTWWVLEH